MTLPVMCIGAGYFSRFHTEAWHRIEGVDLVGVYDRDTLRADTAGVPAAPTLEALLETGRGGIVDVITPPPSHLDLIKTALAYDPAAIICQKPFCESLDQAKRATELAAEASVPLIVHENFRFQPWYRTLKSAIESGHVGDLQQLTFRFRPGDGQGPDAYLSRQPYFQKMDRFLIHETAVHWIDTFRYLMGEPKGVFADLRRMNPSIAGEDAGYILFFYEDGKRALFDGNRLLDHSAENTRCTMGEALIEGSEGTLTLLGNGEVLLRKFGKTTSRSLLGPTLGQGFGGDCVYHLQSHVVRALEGNGNFENTAEDYLSVIEQENLIYSSAEKQATVWL
ncbi:MAG: Gfo/Idh/MocA family oxidoreductase [Pseudomonadota bacterium]